MGYCRNGKYSKGVFGTYSPCLIGVFICGSIASCIGMDYNKSSNIYYNTIIQSVNVFGEGQQYGLLYENDDPEKNQRKYYTMNYAVEPNKLLFDLDKIMDTSSKQKTPTKETVVIVPENNKALKSLEVEVEGTKHTITISQNAEDNPNILINTSSVKESNKNIIVELMHKFAVYSVAS